MVTSSSIYDIEITNNHNNNSNRQSTTDANKCEDKDDREPQQTFHASSIIEDIIRQRLHQPQVSDEDMVSVEGSTKALLSGTNRGLSVSFDSGSTITNTIHANTPGHSDALAFIRRGATPLKSTTTSTGKSATPLRIDASPINKSSTPTNASASSTITTTVSSALNVTTITVSRTPNSNKSPRGGSVFAAALRAVDAGDPASLKSPAVKGALFHFSSPSDGRQGG
jgi:hypothetical protein